MATTFVDYTGDGNATKAFSFPSIQESDVKDYYHNRIIERIFYNARRQAWAKISSQPNVRRVILEQREKEIARIEKRTDTANILNIYK